MKTATFSIGGMHCASCSARNERTLKKLEGVRDATVNFATESARVSVPASVSTGDLISVIEQAGYSATAMAAEPGTAEGAPGIDEAEGLRRRLVVSLALAVPVVVLAMVPAWQFRNWQWAALVLASPRWTSRCSPASRSRPMWARGTRWPAAA